MRQVQGLILSRPASTVRRRASMRWWPGVSKDGRKLMACIHRSRRRASRGSSGWGPPTKSPARGFCAGRKSSVSISSMPERARSVKHELAQDSALIVFW